MKKIIVFVVIFFIVQSIFAYQVRNDKQGRPLYAADRIKVKLSQQATEKLDLAFGVESELRNTGLEDFDNLITSIGVTKIDLAHRPVNDKAWEQQVGFDRWVLFFVPIGTNIERTIAEISNNGYVEHVNPEYIAHTSATPNDPYFDDCWGHDNTASNGPGSGHTVGFDSHAEEAWDDNQGYGSSSIILAIIDTGTDYNHVDLNDNCVAGYDYGDNDSDPMDDSSDEGHGTCCAGVAAGEVNNGIGVAGVAGDCSIMPLKIADSGGSLMFSYIDNAITHCGDNNVDVASMSFGADISQGASPSTDSAISYAYNNGVTMLAATANNDYSHIHFPANHEYVIAVGAASPCAERKSATSCDGQYYWGSNYGVDIQDNRAAVDVIAPTILPATDVTGSNGYSTGDYIDGFNGTSCATPYAAGVAALIKSKNPTLTPAQVRYYLTSTATDVIDEGPAGWDRYTGYGMVNADAAVGAVAGSGFPTCSITNPATNQVIETGTIVTITVDASDPSRSVSSVKIYIDNVLKTTDYSAPYQYTWNTSGETLDFHTIKATATDNESNATDHVITVRIANPTYTIFEDGFETNLGWALTGEFERGTPTGNGGGYGNPDPNSAYQGNNVLGVDLTGLGANAYDYEPSLGDRAYTATSPAFDCSDYSNVSLSFYRWLNVEQPAYDHAYIDVSNNGFSTYTTIWENSSTITDNSWSQMNYDISAVADGNANVQIRFSIGSTDSGWQYSGWNIDDLFVTGEGSGTPTPTITVTSPNGGENWNLGTTETITWNSFNTSGNVKIELYENGSLYQTISSNTTDDGSFSWNIPSGYNEGTQYTINIEDTSDPSIYDYSNSNFTLSVVTNPDITTSPASFNKNLAPDESTSGSLVIGNTGDADLDYSITFAYTREQTDRSYISTAVNYDKLAKSETIAYDPGLYPAPRQGGEDVASAVAITSLPYNNSGTTAGYLDDYDEVCPYSGSTSPDVVYSFAPTVDYTNVTISLCGDTDYDSKLYIYENTVTPGSPFACNDDECTSALGQSYVSELTALSLTGGNTYYIVVDGYGGASGNYEIDMTGDASVPPENWLSLNGGTSVSDTITPGGADDNIIVGFDATGLADGTYTANINISSNDPDEPSIDIPVTLNISSTPLPIPQNVLITVVGSEVQLQWDEVSGAAKYHVWRSADPYSNFVRITPHPEGITENTYTDTVGSEKYFYYITAE